MALLELFFLPVRLALMVLFFFTGAEWGSSILVHILINIESSQVLCEGLYWTGLAQFYDLERSMPYTVPRETQPTPVVSNIF